MKHYTLAILIITTGVFTFTSSVNLSNLSSFKLTSETQLIIQNLRTSPVDSVVITEADPFDFETGSGPQEKFKDLSIPARRTIQRTLQVNTLASRAPFTMELKFNDGTTASFHINMKYAIGDKNSEFRYEAPFNMSFKKVGSTIVVVIGDK